MKPLARFACFVGTIGLILGAPPSLAEDGPITGGFDHSCAVTSAGGVECWGSNFAGQLGDGTIIDRLRPVPVEGLSSGVTAVVAGYDHTCALTIAGAVMCWGHNTFGQLGDGTTTDRPTPNPVMGLTSGVVSIAAGERHTCAITGSGSAQCWGENFLGQLGDGTALQRTAPVTVTGLGSGQRAIVAATYHTCALSTAGAVQCWGSNFYGSLGDGTNDDSPTPVPVVGLSSGVDALATGAIHTCAVTTAGAMHCWGGNLDGGLGDGTTTHRNAPVPVSGLSSGVRAIGAGLGHTCAVTAAGLQCWGENLYGALGDGTGIDRTTPVPVSGASDTVQAISGGSSHTCALATSGAIQCWGRNWVGEVGDGTMIQRFTPVSVLAAFDSLAGTLPPVGAQTLTAASPTSDDLTATDLAVADSALVVAVPGRELVMVFNSASRDFDAAGAAKKAPSPGRRHESWTTSPDALLTAGGGAKVIGDKFGAAVAVSPDGSTIVVGSPLANGGVGEIRIFRRNGSAWAGALAGGTVVGPTSTAGVIASGFGASVALDDTGNLVVGAPDSDVNGIAGAGSVYAFRDTGTVAPNGLALVSGAVQGDGAFGTAVSVHDGVVAVGAPNEDGNEIDSGGAYVFPPTRLGGGDGFTPRQVLSCVGAGGIGDKFRCGTSIAIDDGTVIVGTPGADTPAGSDSGAARVYVPSLGLAPRAVLEPIDGQGQRAGTSVAIARDALVLGAPTATTTRPNQGRVLLYSRPDEGFASGQHRPDATLGSAANGEDRYGTSLSVSRRHLVVGAPAARVYDDASAAIVDAAGRADTYVFDRILGAGFE